MLSICIPIYNVEVRPFVQELVHQCKATGYAWEICCFDDGSDARFEEKNRLLTEIPGVIYQKMPHNLGRSTIRNALGKAAKYDYLLFMDCDSALVRTDFIQKYLAHAIPDTVVYGGRCYAPNPPVDPRLFFHWKYGIEREQTTVQQRQTAPWHSFMTNNFLIPKDLFLKTGFDETLRQYGHEDTLFGLELARQQVSILHIDNPLRHDGLETVDVFLEKTRQGLENLMMLSQKGSPIQTRLLDTWLACRKWGLLRPLRLAFRCFEPLILRQLKSKNPRMLLFDMWKLGRLREVS